MELFEPFSEKHKNRSWCHTSKLLANLKLSSDLHKPKQVQREEVTRSKRIATAFNQKSSQRGHEEKPCKI